MHLRSLFPQHSCIQALPNCHSPRLYLDGETFRKRWKQSAAYPAFRFSARAYRVFLRIKASSALGTSCLSDQAPWIVGNFIQEILPDVQSTVVLAGTAGPSQKFTIQLWDDDKIIAYLKYAEFPLAQKLLRRETEVLLSLPKGLGPSVLKHGQIEQGWGLLMTPLIGRQLSATLPPPKSLMIFLSCLETGQMVSIDRHPWVTSYLLKYGEENIMRWFRKLDGRSWSITYHHGDFAPWNLIINNENKLTAMDWEYGTREGFPLLDLAHYILQVAKLIYRWNPDRAFTYTVNCLRDCGNLKLSLSESKALACITAYLLFLRARVEGHAEDSKVQRWYKAVWDRTS